MFEPIYMIYDTILERYIEGAKNTKAFSAAKHAKLSYRWTEEAYRESVRAKLVELNYHSYADAIVKSEFENKPFTFEGTKTVRSGEDMLRSYLALGNLKKGFSDQSRYVIHKIVAVVWEKA